MRASEMRSSLTRTSSDCFRARTWSHQSRGIGRWRWTESERGRWRGIPINLPHRLAFHSIRIRSRLGVQGNRFPPKFSSIHSLISAPPSSLYFYFFANCTVSPSGFRRSLLTIERVRSSDIWVKWFGFWQRFRMKHWVKNRRLDKENTYMVGENFLKFRTRERPGGRLLSKVLWLYFTRQILEENRKSLWQVFNWFLLIR